MTSLSGLPLFEERDPSHHSWDEERALDHSGNQIRFHRLHRLQRQRQLVLRCPVRLLTFLKLLFYSRGKDRLMTLCNLGQPLLHLSWEVFEVSQGFLKVTQLLNRNVKIGEFFELEESPTSYFSFLGCPLSLLLPGVWSLSTLSPLSDCSSTTSKATTSCRGRKWCSSFSSSTTS